MYKILNLLFINGFNPKIDLEIEDYQEFIGIEIRFNYFSGSCIIVADLRKSPTLYSIDAPFIHEDPCIDKSEDFLIETIEKNIISKKKNPIYIRD